LFHSANVKSAVGTFTIMLLLLQFAKGGGMFPLYCICISTVSCVSAAVKICRLGFAKWVIVH